MLYPQEMAKSVAISHKTRKLLWGKSGNRCAMCRRLLVVEPTSKDDNSVVGDESHIISGQTSGPRYDAAFPTQLIDELENLILLCKVHHKQVDDQHETYGADLLRLQKSNHERWVSETLGEGEKPKPIKVRRVKENIPKVLVRVQSGQELLRATDGTLAYLFGNDPPGDEREMELLSGFFQQLQDWGDVGDDLGQAERIREEFRLSDLMKELEGAGFWIFVGREVRRLEGGIAEPSPFPMGIVKVLRSSSPEIQSFDMRTTAKGDGPGTT